MIELPQSAFESAAPILAQFSHSRVTISSGLEGTQPARIFVDSVQSPSVVVLFHLNTYAIFAGDEGNEDVWAFLDGLGPDQIYGKSRLVFIPETEAWEARLRGWGQGCLWEDRRTFFEYPPEPPGEIREWRRKLEDGVTVIPITADMPGPGASPLLPQIGGQGGTWLTASAYGEFGFGFCLAVGPDEPASTCYTYTAGGGMAEIQVQTLARFRKRGYATIVCSAFVEECRRRNIRPYWECTADNEASVMVARKIGFREAGSFSRLWAAGSPVQDAPAAGDRMRRPAVDSRAAGRRRRPERSKQVGCNGDPPRDLGV